MRGKVFQHSAHTHTHTHTHTAVLNFTGTISPLFLRKPYSRTLSSKQYQNNTQIKKETSTQVFKIQHYIQIHSIPCITLPFLHHAANSHYSRVRVSSQSLSHVQLSYFPSLHANTNQIASC